VRFVARIAYAGDEKLEMKDLSWASVSASVSTLKVNEVV
jgi:hypothetical protein